MFNCCIESLQYEFFKTFLEKFHAMKTWNWSKNNVFFPTYVVYSGNRVHLCSSLSSGWWCTRPCSSWKHGPLYPCAVPEIISGKRRGSVSGGKVSEGTVNGGLLYKYLQVKHQSKKVDSIHEFSSITLKGKMSNKKKSWSFDISKSWLNYRMNVKQCSPHNNATERYLQYCCEELLPRRHKVPSS